MTRRAKPDPASSGDAKLSALETELARVTEDFRLAKLAVKKAKAFAKVVKKEMKRLRKAWVNAQEAEVKATSVATQEKAVTSSSRAKTKAATGLKVKQRVAASPEVVRKPRSKKRQPALVATAAVVSNERAIASSSVGAANEPQLDSEASGSPASSEE